MNFINDLKKILTENPVPPTKQLDMHDYGQSGHETVVLSPEAPEELKKLVGSDGEVVLISTNPYKIKLKNSDRVFTILPKHIVMENKIDLKVKKYTKKYLNFILNK